MKAPSLEIIKITLKKLSDPYFAGYAAEIAFWLLLSLMPAMIVLVQMLQVFTLSIEAVQEIIVASMSGEVYGIVAPLIEYDARKGMTVLLVLLALFAGSNAVFSLMRIINLAYGNLPHGSGTIIQMTKDRLRAILMTLLVLVAMIFALYILVYGELLVKTTFIYTRDVLGEGFTYSEVWGGMRWVIAFILFFIMVFSLYYLLPRSGVSYRGSLADGRLLAVKQVFKTWLKGRRMEYMRAMPGSIFAAIAMLVVTRVFTLLVGNVAFGNINILYGGLSSVVLLLLWLYSIGYVLIAGIQVNAAYLEQDAQDAQDGQAEQDAQDAQDAPTAPGSENPKGGSPEDVTAEQDEPAMPDAPTAPGSENPKGGSPEDVTAEQDEPAMPDAPTAPTAPTAQDAQDAPE